MPGEIGLVLQLINSLLPALLPSELTKLKGQLTKMEEDWKDDKQTLLKALEDGDLGTINLILSKLVDLSEA